jgi:hypothetical protein
LASEFEILLGLKACLQAASLKMPWQKGHHSTKTSFGETSQQSLLCVNPTELAMTVFCMEQVKCDDQRRPILRANASILNR